MEEIVPISRSKSLKERAYDKLKKLIITGNLKQGVLYNERKLAEALGVSRTPVREALLELSREGMVAFVPGRGVEVCKITTKQAREVFEIRRIIEGHIVKEITKKLTSDDIEKLKQNITKQEGLVETDERHAFIEYDKRFHLYLASKIGNRQIEAILINLRDQIHLMGIRAIEDHSRMRQVIKEHHDILACLREGDSKNAYKELIKHLDNTEKILIENIKKENRKSTPRGHGFLG